MDSYMVKCDSSSIKTPFEIFIHGGNFDQQRIQEIFNRKHFFPIIQNCQVQRARLEGQEPRAASKIKSSSTSHFMLLQQSRDSSRKGMQLLIRQLYFERSRSQILLGT
ncbi:hypothetical protein SLEP1_g57287 [Rubroshorea leprosula]|uniref:Uncharacterized protein n=1 Tax=Rubroshorea leprosula TaxID=152421 RepID=A0AAV5MM22_9ROSI|nr:hypothetical protein SLEP1_g57287 [Rubroshorea leprosula]